MKCLKVMQTNNWYFISFVFILYTFSSSVSYYGRKNVNQQDNMLVFSLLTNIPAGEQFVRILCAKASSSTINSWFSMCSQELHKIQCWLWFFFLRLQCFSDISQNDKRLNWPKPCLLFSRISCSFGF